jgi:hypothetical protein
MVQILKVLDDVVATTTSQAVNIEDAKKVVLVYKRADHSSGNTVFSGTVSVDGSNYITYSKWISNTANSNAQGVTRVASVTLSANGVGFLTMDPDDGFKDIKITATETTDGTHSAWLYIEY